MHGGLDGMLPHCQPYTAIWLRRSSVFVNRCTANMRSDSHTTDESFACHSAPPSRKMLYDMMAVSWPMNEDRMWRERERKRLCVPPDLIKLQGTFCYLYCSYVHLKYLFVSLCLDE